MPDSPPPPLAPAFPPHARRRVVALAHALGALPDAADGWRLAFVPSATLWQAGVDPEGDEARSCHEGGGSAGGVTGQLLLSSLLRMMPHA